MMKNLLSHRYGVLLCALMMLTVLAAPCGVFAEEEYVQCDECGGWFMAGNEFRNHICTPVNEPQPEYVQCDVCGNWYEAGNVFRNHICVAAPDSDAEAIGILYVSTPDGRRLHMRSKPSANASVVTDLPNNTQVTLFSYVNSDWAYVAYRSYFGYCAVSFLSETLGGPSVFPVIDDGDIYADFVAADHIVETDPTSPTGFVNLRWAPSINASVQTIYYAGERLYVLATNGTWSQVFNEATRECGFILDMYLKIVQ